jgi:hypothetical protein
MSESPLGSGPKPEEVAKRIASLIPSEETGFDKSNNEFVDGLTEIEGYELHPKVKPYVFFGLFFAAFASIAREFFEIPEPVRIVGYTVSIISICIIALPKVYIWKKK